MCGVVEWGGVDCGCCVWCCCVCEDGVRCGCGGVLIFVVGVFLWVVVDYYL